MDLADLYNVADEFLFKHDELAKCEALISQVLFQSAPNPMQASQTRSMLDIVGDLRYLYRRATWATYQVISLATKVQWLHHRLETCKDHGEEYLSPAQSSLFLQFDVCSNTLQMFIEYWQWAMHEVQTQPPWMTGIMMGVCYGQQ